MHSDGCANNLLVKILLGTSASRLFTIVREGTMHIESNSVVLFTVLYSRFQHCAKDVSKVTAQRTILEYYMIYAGSEDTRDCTLYVQVRA